MKSESDRVGEWLESNDLLWMAHLATGGDPPPARQPRAFRLATAALVRGLAVPAFLVGRADLGLLVATADLLDDGPAHWNGPVWRDFGRLCERSLFPAARDTGGMGRDDAAAIAGRACVSNSSSLVVLIGDLMRRFDWYGSHSDWDRLRLRGANAMRDVFGTPRPQITHIVGDAVVEALRWDLVPLSPAWRTDTVLTLARQMYEAREFSAMPILADALQDAGCDRTDVLDHCRDPLAVHCRGCWVLDTILFPV